jgi:hypothetical protein
MAIVFQKGNHAGMAKRIRAQARTRAMACSCFAALVTWPAHGSAQSIELRLPIACAIGRTCAIQNYVDRDPSPKARDYMCGTLTYDRHDGTDFRLRTMADMRAGVDVLAAADGTVTRVRDGQPDISMKAPTAPSAEGRECGNGIVVLHAGGWETQYCHLARTSVRVKPGDLVRAGQQLGRVGLSGRTEFPHLHFAIRLNGTVVDPFAFGAAEGSCGGGRSLWKPALRPSLVYRERSVLNAGFAAGPLTMEQIEEAEPGSGSVGPAAPALVAYVRAIGMKEGDVQTLIVIGPDGKPLTQHVHDPLDRNKAQYLLFTGKRRPTEEWPRGTYRATYQVTRDGKTVLEEHFSVSF